MENKEKEIKSLLAQYAFWTDKIHGFTDVANKYASDLAALRHSQYLTAEQEKELANLKYAYRDALKSRQHAIASRDNIGYEIIHLTYDMKLQ